MTTEELIRIGQEGKPMERAEAIAQINSELAEGTCELTEEQIRDVYGSPLTQLKIEKYVATIDLWATQRMFIAWLQVATGATKEIISGLKQLAEAAIKIADIANKSNSEEIKTSALKEFEDKEIHLKKNESGLLELDTHSVKNCTIERKKSLSFLLAICAGVNRAANEAMLIRKGGKKLVPPDIIQMLDQIQHYLKEARKAKTFDEMTDFEKMFVVPSNMLGEDEEAYESFIKDFQK